MTAIAASSVKTSTLVDGTLRLTVDIEPKDALDAFTLFRKPGTPMALAALKSASSKSEKPLGPLCQWIVIACQDAAFQRWLSLEMGRPVQNEVEAKEIVCNTCGIESRRELDENEAAAKIFHMKVREPYARWLKSQRQPHE